MQFKTSATNPVISQVVGDAIVVDVALAVVQITVDFYLPRFSGNM